jgi:hypothetical protein
MEYIKRAEKTAESHSTEIRGPIESILRDIVARGEAATRDLASKFDGGRVTLSWVRRNAGS